MTSQERQKDERAAKWHRGDHGEDNATSLRRHWVSECGYEIWQGRPFAPTSQRFVYRLRRPDGSEQDYKNLVDAKSQAFASSSTRELPRHMHPWSATRRAESARNTTGTARTELLAAINVLAGLYEAHLCKTRRPQQGGPDYERVVCVHMPDGAHLTWQLCGAEELERFRDLPMRPDDSTRMTQVVRISHLDALALALRASK